MVDTGNFFAIDRRAWAKVCDLGVNAAISYLILARGTGGDNRTTSWSVKAIEDRTSISRPRAQAALRALEHAQLLTVRSRSTRPQYWLNQAPAPERAALSSFDQTIVDCVKRLGRMRWDGRTFEAKQAKKLVKAGILRETGIYFEMPPEPAVGEPEWIWLPNAIADGLAAETSPVEILWQTQNIDAIRMFGNMYAAHDLRDGAGIEWRKDVGFRRLYEREEVNQRGQYVVWGFPRFEETGWKNCPPIGDFYACRASWDGLWPAVRALTDSGLAQWVAHLVTADTESGDVLHPLPVGGEGEAAELRLAEQAKRAAEALCEPTKDLSKYWITAPVLRHVANVQLVGILRLRYRPQTSATQAWLNRVPELERWASAYEKIADDALGAPSRKAALATSR